MTNISAIGLLLDVFKNNNEVLGNSDITNTESSNKNVEPNLLYDVSFESNDESSSLTSNDDVVISMSKNNNIFTEDENDSTYIQTTKDEETGTTIVSTYDKATGKILSKTETYHVDKNNYDKYWEDKKTNERTNYNVTHEVQYQYNDDGSVTEITRETRDGIGVWGAGKHCSSKTSVKKYDQDGNEITSNAEMKSCFGTGAVQGNYGILGVAIDPTKNNETYQYKNEIKDKGTTYVIFGQTGCGVCNGITSYLSNNKTGQQQIKDLDLLGINVVYADLSDGGMDEAVTLAKNLNLGINEETGNIGLPIIVKYVDGKAVGCVDCSGITDMSTSMSDYLLNNVVYM